MMWSTALYRSESWPGPTGMSPAAPNGYPTCDSNGTTSSTGSWSGQADQLVEMVPRRRLDHLLGAKSGEVEGSGDGHAGPVGQVPVGRGVEDSEVGAGADG